MAKDMSGSISKNERKEQENHPDIKGSCTIDGVDYWISGWMKENERGKWYSLSFKVKEEKAPAKSVKGAKPSAPSQQEMDDDLPFAPERGL